MFARLLEIDICDRIIAMGFPSEKLEGIYRNPFTEVKRYATNARHSLFVEVLSWHDVVDAGR